MFFILSKTLSLLVLPSNLMIAVGVAGLLLLLTRWRRLGLRLAVASLVLLVFFGFVPVGNVLTAALENRFPPWSPSGAAPAGIIILGGAIDPDLSQERGEPVIGSSVQRLTVARALARDFPQARIVYSGGNGSLSAGGASEADFAGPLLASLGIPGDRILLERKSRNTAENAAFTKAMVQPKPGERWLLVTSAEHMPRAVGCFRQVGFEVEAYPVGGRSSRRISLLLPMQTLASGLGRLDHAVHEWTGLIAYWVTGRTSEFFPAPQPSKG